MLHLQYSKICPNLKPNAQLASPAIWGSITMLVTYCITSYTCLSRIALTTLAPYTHHIITVTTCSHGNLQVLREHQQVRGDLPVRRNLQVLVVQDVQDCQQYQELQQCHHHQVVQLVQGSLVEPDKAVKLLWIPSYDH